MTKDLLIYSVQFLYSCGHPETMRASDLADTLLLILWY